MTENCVSSWLFLLHQLYKEIHKIQILFILSYSLLHTVEICQIVAYRLLNKATILKSAVTEGGFMHSVWMLRPRNPATNQKENISQGFVGDETTEYNPKSKC